MFNPFKTAADMDRLEAELSAAKEEIKRLRALPRTDFVEVAKDFDAAPILRHAMDKIVEDLTPMLERDLVDALKQIARQLARDPHFGARGRVAYDLHTMSHVFRVQIHACGTEIRVAHFP